MKIRERALAILLSMVMMLAFMPAMAFAEDEEPVADGTPVAEETVATEEAVETPDVDSEAVVNADQDINEVTEENTAMTTQSTDWDLDEEVDISYKGSPVTLEPIITGDVPEQLYYQWYVGAYDEEYEFYYTEIPGATGKAYSGVTADDSDGVWYKVEVTDSDDVSKECEFWVGVDVVTQGAVTYYAYDARTCGATISRDATGEISILASVAFTDGRTRTVTYVSDNYSNSTAVHVPSTVTEIEDVGWSDYDWDENKGEYVPTSIKPGFVIFGTNGTYAQTYANKYGITFRDLAAEAEAARQGTPDKSLPKVKITKPKAAKKAATVKWKKLSKKQLKKSKAQKIEVWVCPNGGFGANDTIMKTTGKKKASLKVKGLKKGTYFVKVRAIKYVGGTKMVGPWSKVKKVKIKK